jgi:hypothetical protein
MFDSGISVKDLVEELKNTEVDIALDIPDNTYVQWLNSLQQMLYTEIIKEQKKVTISTFDINKINLSSIYVQNDENAPRFEDIYTIFADGVQLIKSTLTSGSIFPNTFYKDNNDIGYHTKNVPSWFTIVYIVKPALVTVTDDEINDANVMVPIEFIDLVKAKLRGEAYKLANEDGIGAKWLNDYNILLETFKAWISVKAPSFGM